jgi:hypothetical protein
MSSKEIKNPKEQPEIEATKSEELTTDEVIKKIQEAYRAGFKDGFTEADKLIEAEENETDEE